MQSLLSTLLELGHSTSQNLGYAHLDEVNVSYGEETITETNLLEIRRPHPDKVELLTFSKSKESRETGADWEWHIIGKVYTLKMRVQAKRVYKMGGIRNLNQKGRLATKPQINLLIDDAAANNLFPAYCFYCSEVQRNIWNTQKPLPEFKDFESGCLIACAKTVLNIMPKNLADIEHETIPWHYLCLRGDYAQRHSPYGMKYLDGLPTERILETMKEISQVSPDKEEKGPRLPTISELNKEASKTDEMTGVFRTEGEDIHSLDYEKFQECGITRLLRVDVRSSELFWR